MAVFNVDDCPAIFTDQVVVISGVTVVVRFLILALVFQFQNLFVFFKEIKISVYGRQVYRRDAFFYYFVDLLGGWVSANLTQLFQDNSALFREARSTTTIFTCAFWHFAWVPRAAGAAGLSGGLLRITCNSNLAVILFLRKVIFYYV